MALQETLLQLFRQVQGMTSTQRYYFANQSKILLEEYDIFKEATVLYEEELSDQLSRGFDLLALNGYMNLPQSSVRSVYLQRAKASILNTFGFFLELNTHRTFWRAMELTANAFALHSEKFDEEADAQAVLTDKAKKVFFKWLAHLFWSLQHAQFRLDELRARQYLVYQRNAFPFFPYTLEALKTDSDIQLIIAKLSKVPVYDFPLLSSLFLQLEQASKISEQMANINAEIMAAIDELSSRFRVLERLLLIGQLVAPEDEVKSALLTFKFETNGKDIHSRTDDVMETITRVHQGSEREPIPKKPSYLQMLIVKENHFRQQHADRIILPALVSADRSGRFSERMFDTFKSSFTLLYRESIRRQWKEHEYSLLGLDVAQRVEHRRVIEEKKKPPSPSNSFEQTDTADARSVPDKQCIDPSLFWVVGDGTSDKYVPPVIRTKIKTRKEVGNGEQAGLVNAEEGPATPNSPVVEAPTAQVQRPVDQLKHTDLTTRDILWRKVKGKLKWSNLVQLLQRLGCRILNLDGSKRKIVDPATGLCTVLHRPHPGDECRPDQRESYRVHLEDWLNIQYSSFVSHSQVAETESSDGAPSSGSGD